MNFSDDSQQKLNFHYMEFTPFFTMKVRLNVKKITNLKFDEFFLAFCYIQINDCFVGWD